MRSKGGADELSGLEESGLIRKGAGAVGRQAIPEADRRKVSSDSEKRETECGADQGPAYADESRGAVKKAMNLLLQRDRSEKELRDRLLGEAYEPEAVQDAINYTSSFGYLDDARFAENYVASFTGKKSRRVMRSELEQKGVDEVLIDRALEAVPEDESDQIRKLLRKKAGAPHKLDDREKRRAAAFLARRGFSGSDVWKAIRTFESETDD
jgi:regulatory protein